MVFWERLVFLFVLDFVAGLGFQHQLCCLVLVRVIGDYLPVVFLELKKQQVVEGENIQVNWS